MPPSASIRLLTLLIAVAACSDDALQLADPPPARPASLAAESAEFNPERNLYFGDTHVHTAYSFDAYLLGNRLRPASPPSFRSALGPRRSG